MALRRQRQVDLCELESCLVLRRQRQVDLCEFKACLVLKSQRQVDLSEFKAHLIYRVSSRLARTTRRSCLKGIEGGTKKLVT